MVRLIIDEDRTIPHYVETDCSDAEVWHRILAAVRTVDPLVRRARLRSLRSQLNDRVVEVPHSCAFTQPEEQLGIVHVPIKDSAHYYDTKTGWKRPL